MIRWFTSPVSLGAKTQSLKFCKEISNRTSEIRRNRCNSSITQFSCSISNNSGAFDFMDAFRHTALPHFIQCSHIGIVVFFFDNLHIPSGFARSNFGLKKSRMDIFARVTITCFAGPHPKFLAKLIWQSVFLTIEVKFVKFANIKCRQIYSLYGVHVLVHVHVIVLLHLTFFVF